MNQDFSWVSKVLHKVKDTQGTKAKLSLIKTYSENKTYGEILKKTLKHLFDPDIRTGIEKVSWNKTEPGDPSKCSITKLGELIDFIEDNTGKLIYISEVKAYLSLCKNEEEEEFLFWLATRDIQIGINTIGVQNTLGILNVFNIMLGSSMNEAPIDFSQEVVLSQKLDGHNITAFKKGEEVYFRTRNGRIKTGLDQLAEEYRTLPDGVYFGEAMYEEEIQDRGERYRLTTSELNTDKYDKKITHYLFDYLPWKVWEEKDPNWKYYQAINWLQKVDGKVPHIKMVPIVFRGRIAFDKVKEELQKALDKGWEGLMLRYSNSPYEWKRSKNLIKLKKFYTMDLKIVGYQEYKKSGMLGTWIVEYKGNQVKVGTGFTEKQRIQFWKTKDLHIGRIVEVQYMEETTNKVDGKKSLRFPVFIRMRPDKEEVSYS